MCIYIVFSEDLLFQFTYNSIFTFPFLFDYLPKRGCATFPETIYSHIDRKLHVQLTLHICIMYACKILFNVAELHYALVACLQGKQSPV